ncbi:aldo/keto reductase [Neptunicella sp. SCSIO 80796]|uniref:aldo/keto reductase n=1 Tax=Neptunicella plasticusilytica TaxID=3117012 RepID=UPI003A4E561E
MSRPVKKRIVGNTGVVVTELGLGGASLGNLYQPMTDSSAKQIVDYLHAQQLQLFDTAPYYGFGLSESRLGNALDKIAGDFVLSTKVGRVLHPIDDFVYQGPREGFCSEQPFSAEFDYSYDGIMQSYQASLQRLQTDKIDILLVHDIGRQTHGAKHQYYLKQFKNSGYRALQELKNRGAVRAIGLGVNETEICMELMLWADFDCFLLAGRYTLLEQGALTNLFAECLQRGISVIAGGIFNSGILASGKQHSTRYYNYQPAPDNVLRKVAQLQAVCEVFDVQLAAAALQFVLAHPVVCAAIPGIASLEQAQQIVQYYNAEIPQAFWQVLKDQQLISPLSPVPQSLTAQC